MKIDTGTDYGKIAYLKVNELENNVRINKKNVTKNTQDIANLRNEISGGIDVSQLQTDVNSLSQSLTTAQTTITNNTNDINTNKQNILTNTNQINTINTQINNINEDISSIDSDLNLVKSQTTDITQQISTLAQESQENTDNIAINTTNIQSLTTNIQTVEADVESINTQLNDVNNKLSLGVVNTSTNQEINGNKTFSNDIKIKSADNIDKSIIISNSNDTTITRIRASISTGNTVFNSNGYYFRNENNVNTGVVIHPDLYIYSESDNKIDIGSKTKKFKNLYIAENLSDGNNSISIKEIVEPKGKLFKLKGDNDYYSKIFESGQISGTSNTVDIIFMISNVDYSNFYRDGVAIYQLTYSISVGEESTLFVKRIAGSTFFDEYLYINYVKTPTAENEACFEIYMQKTYSSWLTFHFAVLKNTMLNEPNKIDYTLYTDLTSYSSITSLGETVLFKDIVRSNYVSTTGNNEYVSGLKKFRFIEIENGCGLVSRLSPQSDTTELVILRGSQLFLGNDYWATVIKGNLFYPEISNNIDLGRLNNKWKDLYLAGNAYIGGSLSDGTNVVTLAEMRNAIESSGTLNYIARFTDRIAVIHSGTQNSRHIKFELLPTEKYTFKYNIKLYSDNTPKKYRVNFYIDETIVLYDDITTSNSDTFVFDFDYVANSEMVFTWVEFVPSNEQYTLSVEWINIYVDGLEAKCATPKGQFCFIRNGEKLSVTFCNCQDICVLEDITNGIDIPSTFTSVNYSEDNLNPTAAYFEDDKYELIDGVVQKVESKPYIYFCSREYKRASCIYQIDTQNILTNIDPMIPIDHNHYIFDSIQRSSQGTGRGAMTALGKTSSGIKYIRLIDFDYNGRQASPSPYAIGNFTFARENKPLNINTISDADVKYFDSDTPRTSYYPAREMLVAFDGKIYFMNTKSEWYYQDDFLTNSLICNGDAAYGFYTDCDRTQLAIFVFDYNGKNYKRFYQRTDVEFGTSVTSTVFANQLWEFVGEVQLDFVCDNMYLLYGKIYYEYEGKIFIKDDTYNLSTQN